PNIQPTEDYSGGFLSHVKLYVFAEKCQIQGLKGMAAQHLHDVLRQFNCYLQRIEDIIDLVEYVYYDNPPEREQHEEILREVVSWYTANKLQK
ncbi:hypothetical protein K432DRAFT_254358, partial [Lepidopterella palustris CBS 459.81]